MWTPRECGALDFPTRYFGLKVTLAQSPMKPFPPHWPELIAAQVLSLMQTAHLSSGAPQFESQENPLEPKLQLSSLSQACLQFLSPQPARERTAAARIEPSLDGRMRRC
jgi:hypothetical protein